MAYASASMFYGESMFARVTDGSKIALAWLVAFLRGQGVTMVDCQQETGAPGIAGRIAPISRAAFLSAFATTAIAQTGLSPTWKPGSHISRQTR